MFKQTHMSNHPKCCKTEKGLSQNDVKPDGLKPHFHQENSHTLKTESLNFIGDKMGETNKSLILREIQKIPKVLRFDVATISDSWLESLGYILFRPSYRGFDGKPLTNPIPPISNSP